MSKNYQYLIKTILYNFSGISIQYQELIINYFEDNYPFMRDNINFCEIYNNRFKGKSHSEKIDIFVALCKCKGLCGFEANEHEGLELLREVQNCSNFKNEEINKEIESSKKRQIPQTRYELFNSFDPKKRIEWKCNYWRKYEYEDKNKIPASIADLTESESIIFDFIRSCVLILHDKKNNTNNYNINSFNIDPNDILAFEKQTVNILIGRSSNREIAEYLKKYDKYHIAQVLSEDYQFGKKLNELVEILLDNFIEEGIKDDKSIIFSPYNQVTVNNYKESNCQPIYNSSLAYNEPSTRKEAFNSFNIYLIDSWKHKYWENYTYQKESEKSVNDFVTLNDFEKSIFSFIQNCVIYLKNNKSQDHKSGLSFIGQYNYDDLLDFEIGTFNILVSNDQKRRNKFLKENLIIHPMAGCLLRKIKEGGYSQKELIEFFLDNFVFKARQE